MAAQKSPDPKRKNFVISKEGEGNEKDEMGNTFTATLQKQEGIDKASPFRKSGMSPDRDKLPPID